MNIIENQDLRKTLIDRTGEKVNINEIKDINFSLVSGPNKIINQKTIESIDKDEQTLLEEKVKVKKIFEEYEDKPTKKIKRTNEEVSFPRNIIAPADLSISICQFIFNKKKNLTAFSI